MNKVKNLFTTRLFNCNLCFIHHSCSFRSPSPSPFNPADEVENPTGIVEIQIPHENISETSDQEEQEVSVEIDFREEEEEEEEEGSAEIYSLESGDIIKRDVGSFRFRDSFHYRRSSSNFGSDSEDERPDIVTPAPGKLYIHSFMYLAISFLPHLIQSNTLHLPLLISS